MYSLFRKDLMARDFDVTAMAENIPSERILYNIAKQEAFADVNSFKSLKTVDVEEIDDDVIRACINVRDALDRIVVQYEIRKDI
jgi:hypothetical protein